MGKYKHEGKGRNISVSGGQERKDLFKDMSGGYNAMGDSNSPNYKYNGSAFKQRYSKSPAHKELVGKQHSLPSELKSAIEAAPEMKGSPMYKSGCTSGSGSNAPYKKLGDPKKKAKLASVEQKPKGRTDLEKKKIIKPKPKAKQKIHRYIEQKENGKVIKTIGTKPGSPAKNIGDPKSKLKGKISKLSGKHKKLYDAYDRGQKVDEGKLGRVEDKLERKEKKYTKKYGSSPYSMMDVKPKGKMKKEVRKLPAKKVKQVKKK